MEATGGKTLDEWLKDKLTQVPIRFQTGDSKLTPDIICFRRYIEIQFDELKRRLIEKEIDYGDITEEKQVEYFKKIVKTIFITEEAINEYLELLDCQLKTGIQTEYEIDFVNFDQETLMPEILKKLLNVHKQKLFDTLKYFSTYFASNFDFFIHETLTMVDIAREAEYNSKYSLNPSSNSEINNLYAKYKSEFENRAINFSDIKKDKGGRPPKMPDVEKARLKFLYPILHTIIVGLSKNPKQEHILDKIEARESDFKLIEELLKNEKCFGEDWKPKLAQLIAEEIKLNKLKLEEPRYLTTLIILRIPNLFNHYYNKDSKDNTNPEKILSSVEYAYKNFIEKENCNKESLNSFIKSFFGKEGDLIDNEDVVILEPEEEDVST